MLPEPLMSEVDFGYDEVPDLYERFEVLRKSGPIVPVKFWDAPIWLVMGHHEVGRIFDDTVNFDGAAFYDKYAAPSQGRTLQAMQGAEHRQNRAIVTPPFLPGKVRHFVEHAIEPILHELLDRIEGKDEVEFIEAFTRPFPFTVITRMLGIPVADEAMLLQCAIKLIDFPWDPEGALKAKADFDAYIAEIVGQRRAAPGEDLISVIVNAQVEGKSLTDEEALAFIRLLFPAGSDTTYKLGGSLFANVLANREFSAMARDSDKGRAALVTEALRWQTPVALQPRIATGDVELGGVQIKKGDFLALAISAANNDPAVFPDGRRFDPGRNNSNILSFGHGAHFCLGMHLARRELETALRIVFERFPDMQLSPNRPVEYFGGVLRGPRELWVRPGGAS